MYRLLLVEDEKIELDTLRNYVDWASIGIDEVFTARGGRSALEVVNSREPDILITDIEMPGMSGIDLVEILRQEGHDCKVIFLTGYDKFEYAKEAIRLEVDEFLLKPFQIDEVMAATQKLLKKIKKERKEKEFHKLALGKLIEKACHGDVQDLENMASYYFQKPLDQVFVNVMALNEGSNELKKKILQIHEVLHAFDMDGLFMVIFPAPISSELMGMRIEKLAEDDFYQLVTYKEETLFAQLKEVCDQLKQCEDDLFYTGQGQIFCCSSHAEYGEYEDRIKSLMKKNLLLESVLAGDMDRARDYLIQCLESLVDLNKGGFCQNAFSLYLYIHRQLDNMGNLDASAKVPEILGGKCYEHIQTCFVEYIEDCCRACKLKNSSKWSSYVQQFVRDHYMEDCTVEEMAEGLNVTPNYLRRKFKEETGMTILEFLTEIRLSTAARMLEHKDRKVKDVSVAVGYPNISYFTQLFSKKYGVTPNEYKKMV